MRLIFCFFAIIFMIGCSNNQSTEKRETLVEKTIETYPDGTKKSVDYYSSENTKTCVKQEDFYPNGKLRFSLLVNNGMKHGRCYYYFENGQLWTDQNYKNDSKEGNSIVYSENGKRKIEGSYLNDQPHGKWLFFDSDGKLSKTVIYKNGEIISQN